MAKQQRKAVEQKIKAAVSKSSETLGAISYWSIQNVAIKVTDLEKLFDEVGLDRSYMPSDIRGTAAFRKAVRKVRGNKDARGYMVRPIKIEGSENVCFGIVKETVDEKRADLLYDHSAVVTYDRDSKSVKVQARKSDPQAREIARQIKADYEELTDTLITSDIYRMLTRNVSWKGDGIAMRRSGGFYFSLPQDIEMLEKHQLIVAGLPGDSEMGLIVITDSSGHNKRSLQREAQRALEDQLADLKKEIETFKTTTPRAATLDERLRRYQEMKKKAQTFSTVLGMTVDSFTQGIKDCEQIVKTELLGAAEEKGSKSKQARRVRKTK